MVLIQLCDVLTGLTQARFNGEDRIGPAKLELLRHLEEALGHPVQATNVAEQKFNVFEIQPRGMVGKMAGYPPLLKLADEAAYRARFEAIYCAGAVRTFDGIAVRFL
ncbi:MAG: hypothetical protein R3F31_20720 [Verrucomicrobiales bacterium]